MTDTDITVTYGNENTINVVAPISNQLNATTTKVDYAGSDCTGTTGATGRTLTHTKTMEGQNSQIIRNRAFLMPTYDYTISAAIITFLINIDDEDTILVMA